MDYALAPVGAGDEVRAFFDRLPARVADRRGEGGTAIFAFAIQGAGDWHAVLTEEGCAVQPGPHPSADVRIACAAEDWLSMAAGDLDPQLAYRTGRLTVDGDMGLAMRVRSLFL
jgi:putative sterol carrier protein